jgi:hypothetical protein
MTREDLLRLIARAVRRSFTFASESQALGTADTVLRDMKACGIRIFGPRGKTDARRAAGGADERGSAQSLDEARDRLNQDDQPQSTGRTGEHHDADGPCSPHQAAPGPPTITKKPPADLRFRTPRHPQRR